MLLRFPLYCMKAVRDTESTVWNRKSVLDKIRETARRHLMVVVAGSYYDDERQSRLLVIGPDWEETGYKIRPSRFEASPQYGQGMKPGSELLLLKTRFGRIVPLTCVDLISDAVQYEVRNLATRGEIDVIANLNFNPATWEFMIEANSIARRHAVFVSITNAASTQDPRTKSECQKTGTMVTVTVIPRSSRACAIGSRTARTARSR